MTRGQAADVTMQQTRLRRRLARASFAGAAALLVAAGWPGGSSGAASPPDFDYVSVASAVGIQAQLDSNPEPTPVPDLTDLEAPTSNARLDSFGTSSAQADIGNLNGIAKLPGLICLAAGGCDGFPTAAGVGFPPANPLEADASDPGTPDAVAPAAAGQAATVEGGQAGLATYSAGVAHAHAVPLTTHTDATAGAFDLLNAIHVGAVTTTSDQSAAASGVTAAATSTVSDIDIGTGLIHIGSISITTATTATTSATPTDQTSVTVGGVTVFGQAATIDSTGIHVGSAVPLAGQLQALLASTLQADGLAVTLGGVTRSDGDDGHHVTGDGLILTLDTPLSGVPPINVGLPAGVPCPVPGQVASQLPIDPCSGIGLNLNAAYHGQIVLGSTGTVDEALTNPLLSGLPTFSLPADPVARAAAPANSPAPPAPRHVPSATTTGTPASVAPVGEPDAGTAVPTVAVPGDSASPVLAVAAGSSGPPAGVPRAEALKTSTTPLSDIGLGWVLGAFALAALGMLLGRRGVPARLPSRS